jgi:hypothetical protein
MLKPGEGADVGFLHHVLGFGIVAQDAARHAEQAAIIALRLVPAARAALGVRHRAFRCRPIWQVALAWLGSVASDRLMQIGEKGSRRSAPAGRRG